MAKLTWLHTGHMAGVLDIFQGFLHLAQTQLDICNPLPKPLTHLKDRLFWDYRGYQEHFQLAVPLFIPSPGIYRYK
ncbi:unnamed protein product [marine sediment metagenome]|uniref:Uncharacterized protein n=1 Tax=marine sediment metagenome TaxID=412755 RepID=X1TB14_9ZZZZ